MFSEDTLRIVIYDRERDVVSAYRYAGATACYRRHQHDPDGGREGRGSSCSPGVAPTFLVVNYKEQKYSERYGLTYRVMRIEWK